MLMATKMSVAATNTVKETLSSTSRFVKSCPSWAQAVGVHLGPVLPQLEEALRLIDVEVPFLPFREPHQFLILICETRPVCRGAFFFQEDVLCGIAEDDYAAHSRREYDLHCV